MIKISAVICTYKRANYLRAALQSLCAQSLSRDKYEIIVIDNADEQEAELVVNEFRNTNVELRYLIERQVGLSHARNTGLREARGKYVAYLDDDARADAHWLESLLDAFEKEKPAAVGGRVWLDWDGEKPGWVRDEQLWLFSFVDHGDEGHALRTYEYLVGANLAFQISDLKAVGGFDGDLGRKGSVLLSGEESKVLDEMRERGWAVYYEPAALVWHSVHPSRKRPQWLLRRVFWDGASQPLMDRHRRSRLSLLRGLVYDLRQCASWAVRALAAWILGRRNVAWHSMLGLSQRAGRLRTQMLMLARSHD
jgi:glycosyltransferase involved in cell wall biosynthesis